MEIEDVWVTSCLCSFFPQGCLAALHNVIETPPWAQTFNGSRFQIILIFLLRKPLNEWPNNYKPNAINLITVKSALSTSHYKNIASTSRNSLFLIFQILYAYCIGLILLTLIRIQTPLISLMSYLHKHRLSFRHNFVPKPSELLVRQTYRPLWHVLFLQLFNLCLCMCLCTPLSEWDKNIIILFTFSEREDCIFNV